MPRTFLGEPAKASFEVSLSEQSTLRRPFKGSECNGLFSTVITPDRVLNTDSTQGIHNEVLWKNICSRHCDSFQTGLACRSPF